MSTLKSYPNYRVCVEAYIVRESAEGKQVLLCKRAPNKNIAPNVWSVPAGKVEYDEIPEDSVVREVEEETGFVGEFKHIHSRVDTYEVIGGDDMIALQLSFVGKCGKDFVPILEMREFSEYSWADRDAIVSNTSLQEIQKEIILTKVLR